MAANDKSAALIDHDFALMTRFEKEMTLVQREVARGELKAEAALARLHEHYKQDVLEKVLQHLARAPETPHAFLRHICDQLPGDMATSAKILSVVSTSGNAKLMPQQITHYLEDLDDEAMVTKQQLREMFYVAEAKKVIAAKTKQNPMHSPPAAPHQPTHLPNKQPTPTHPNPACLTPALPTGATRAGQGGRQAADHGRHGEAVQAPP